MFAESSKAFIVQKFRRLLVRQSKSTELCSSAAVVPQKKLPRCEARRHHFIMTCDISCTGRTSILDLCYLFGKTHKQPTGAPLKSLKSTHSKKIIALVETNHTISLAFKTFSKWYTVLTFKIYHDQAASGTPNKHIERTLLSSDYS